MEEFKETYDNGAGKLVVDVDLQGNVKFSNSYEKDVDGYAKIASETSISANILDIAAKIAAKTQATWDDAAVLAIKNLLGLSPVPPTEVK